MYGARKLNGINALIGMAMALIPLGFYVIVLIRMTPVFENLKKNGGVLVGQLTGLFFMVFILMAGGYILAVLGQLVPVSLITGMSEEWITFWAVLVCMTGIRGGMPGRGRMAQISGGVLLGGMDFDDGSMYSSGKDRISAGYGCCRNVFGSGDF